VGAPYPDFGCTIESYSCDTFLEAETLGPLATVPPGGQIVHVEHWYLFEDVDCDPGSEESIQRVLVPLINSTEAPEL
jgi:hypothetical protein